MRLINNNSLVHIKDFVRHNKTLILSLIIILLMFIVTLLSYGMPGCGGEEENVALPPDAEEVALEDVGIEIVEGEVVASDEETKELIQKPKTPIISSSVGSKLDFAIDKNGIRAFLGGNKSTFYIEFRNAISATESRKDLCKKGGVSVKSISAISDSILANNTYPFKNYTSKSSDKGNCCNFVIYIEIDLLKNIKSLTIEIKVQNSKKLFKIIKVTIEIPKEVKDILKNDSINKCIETYYISNDGDDANTGKEEYSPWKTIEKVNNTIFNPGACIFFKSGDEWREILKPSSSGTKENPIVFKTYGSGKKNPRLIRTTKYSNFWNYSLMYDGSFEYIMSDNQSPKGSAYLNDLDFWRIGGNPQVVSENTGNRFLQIPPASFAFQAIKAEENTDYDLEFKGNNSNTNSLKTEIELKFTIKNNEESNCICRLYLLQDGNWKAKGEITNGETNNASLSIANTDNKWIGKNISFKTKPISELPVQYCGLHYPSSGKYVENSCPLSNQDISDQMIEYIGLQFMFTNSGGVGGKSSYIDEINLYKGKTPPETKIYTGSIKGVYYYGGAIRNGNERLPVFDIGGGGYISKLYEEPIPNGYFADGGYFFYIRSDSGKPEQIEIGKRPYGILLRGVHDIIIENLDVWGVGGNAFQFLSGMEMVDKDIQPYSGIEIDEDSYNINIKDLEIFFGNSYGINSTIGTSNINYVGLDINNNSGGGAYIKADSGSVMNCHIHHNAQVKTDAGDVGGLLIWGGNLIIEGNNIHHNGSEEGDKDGTCKGPSKPEPEISTCYISGPLKITRNYIHDCGSSCIGIIQTSFDGIYESGVPEYIKIADLLKSKMAEGKKYNVDLSPDHEVSYNIIDGFGTAKCKPPESIPVYSKFSGIGISSNLNVSILNNVIANGEFAATDIVEGSGDKLNSNATIYVTGNKKSGYYADNLMIINNIFYKNNTREIDIHASTVKQGNTVPSGHIYNNNLYYKKVDSSNGYWRFLGPYANSVIYDLASWNKILKEKLQISNPTETIISDSPFLKGNCENENCFKLKNNSPAIDKGQDLGLLLDFFNNKVPNGKAPDIGAHESE